jgi:FkbM family methyltransferase
MPFSRWGYYLTSLPTLLTGIKNWAAVARRLLRPTDRSGILIELENGCRFKVRSVMDIWVIKETCLDRDYEHYGCPLEDDWVIVDIGAGLGDFAICAARAHPRSQIYAYEPFPESFKLLRENIALNEATNISSFPYAIGAQSGIMHLDTTAGAAVQHSTVKSSVSSAEASSTIQVAGFSLDDMLKEQEISHCDFLKVDCEGGEFDIFFNTSNETLAKIANICLEYHNGVTRYSHVDLMDFFTRNGFRVSMHSNPAHRHLGFLYAAK